ncbi:hypothetical protein [Armatimonas rosea]|uniref:Uncharacterized protein n=1 Tax=Armatimonas rosea TaxID=685828 RepID=A0A7W9SY65_ARMRO|nr:hypothetical protein [Armatimonas rosea]MBB6054029.1 hypothetical protein [Armatimonas rosea]
MTIRRKMRVFPAGLFAVATLLVASGAALAQTPNSGSSQQGSMGCPMMGNMGSMMGGMNQMGRMGGGMGMGMMGRMNMNQMGRGMGMQGCMMGRMNQMGGMGGGNMGGGMGMMNGGMADMGTIHSLFAQSGTISRTVKILPNGIEALTESSDPQTVGLLQEHVAAMKTRLEKNQPIRQGDPLFAALFQNADKVVISVTATERGVKVVETSEDAYTVKLLQSHAQAVSDFIKNGMAGMHTFHPVPPRQ